MDTEKGFWEMAEQQLEQDCWTVRIHKDTVRLYAMYLMGILVGLFLSRKVTHAR